jgi:catechol 2,3-dioxygenase-like lactoylglutathione lyase family enzyme
MSLGDAPHQATKLEVLEWVEPRSRPQPERSAHHAGVSRLALRTKDLPTVARRLAAAGVSFEGEIVEIDLVGARRFVLLRDPDGTLLELIEFRTSEMK